MLYCENCSFAADRDFCPICGNKKLRRAEADDFCLLLEDKRESCEIWIDLLKEKGIPYCALPYGSGVESRFALPLSNYRLYVTFDRLSEAKDMIRQIESVKTEELRKYLLENSDKFNISPKAEKKIRKKLKIESSENFSDYCENVIRTAGKISDNGRIGTSVKGGHYLYCVTNEFALAVNSETFEILSLSRRG